MKHKLISGIIGRQECFEEQLDAFRSENRISESHFCADGKFMYMLYEYTPKKKATNGSTDTSSKDATTGTDGAETPDETGSAS